MEAFQSSRSVHPRARHFPSQGEKGTACPCLAIPHCLISILLPGPPRFCVRSPHSAGTFQPVQLVSYLQLVSNSSAVAVNSSIPNLHRTMEKRSMDFQRIVRSKPVPKRASPLRRVFVISQSSYEVPTTVCPRCLTHVSSVTDVDQVSLKVHQRQTSIVTRKE